MSFEDIIDRVKTRPEIWQRTHPLYKNKLLRLRIWNQMSKELGTDANQLKKSWKYLSDQFRREFKKMKSLALYKGKPIPCGWAYYERLSFLEEEMTMRRDRKPARLLASSDSDTAANDSAMTQDRNSIPTTTQESQEPFPTTQETVQQEDNDDNAYNFENVTWKYNVAKQHSKQAKPGPSGLGLSKADMILLRLQNLTATVERSQSDVMKNDEDFMFFMSILPMVRTLSPVKKLQLRGKINEWLLKMLSETDPLSNLAQYVPAQGSCEDDKQAVMKQIMEAEDDD